MTSHALINCLSARTCKRQIAGLLQIGYTQIRKMVGMNRKAFFALLLALSGSLHAVDPPAEPILRVETGMHADAVFRIDSDAEGRLILSCSADKTARLWDARSGELIRVFRPPIGEGHDGKLYACALSPDGKRVAVGNWTGYESRYGGNFLFIFETRSGKIVKRLSGLKEIPKDMEFSADGRYLAVALSGSGGVRIYDTSTWGLYKRLEGYADTCNGLSFDGKGRLATASWDGSVRLYGPDFHLQKVAASKKNAKPNRISFSPSGSQIAVGFYDNSGLQILDGHDLSLLHELKADNISDAYLNLQNVSWSLDERYLYAASSLWSRGEGRLINHIRKIDLQNRNEATDLPAASGEIVDMKVTGAGDIVYCGKLPEIGLLDAGGSRRFYRKGEIIAFDPGDKAHLKVSRDGLRVGFDAIDHEPMTFSIEDRSLIVKESTIPRTLPVRAACP